MPRKLKSRHPAVYTHRKYSNILKLIAMNTPAKKVTLTKGDNSLDIYIWRVSAGSVKIGAVDWLVELLQKYPKPSIDFLNEFLPKIRQWQKDKEVFEGVDEKLSLGSDGLVIFKETEVFNTILIDKKFERFVIAEKYKESLSFFAQACKEAKSSGLKAPDHRKFNISYDDASKIKNKFF